MTGLLPRIRMHPHIITKYWFHAFAISHNIQHVRRGGTDSLIRVLSALHLGVTKRIRKSSNLWAQCGQSVTAAMRTGGSGIGWGKSIKGVWTVGVSIKHPHHRRGCFLLVKVYRKSGDGAALSPAAPQHKSNFPVPRHKNLVSLISHPAIGDFELSTFISSLAEIKPGFETPTLWNSAFNTGTSHSFFTAPAERKGAKGLWCFEHVYIDEKWFLEHFGIIFWDRTGL